MNDDACRACEGRGFRDDHNGYAPVTVECATCGGSGVVAPFAVIGSGVQGREAAPFVILKGTVPNDG